MTGPIRVVRTTYPDRAVAEDRAARLVADRVAACVQLQGPVSSTYRWDGIVERAEEWVCECKTSAAALESCIAAIRAAHPYALPQIVWEEASATADFAAWVAESTAPLPRSAAENTT